MNYITEFTVQQLWGNSQQTISEINSSYLLSFGPLLTIRIILFLYTGAIFFWELLAYATSPLIYVKYLTLWGAFFEFFYFYFAVVENLSYLANKKKPFLENNWRCCHFFFAFTFCVQPLITVMFWAIVYPNIAADAFTPAAFALNVNLHGILFLAIAIEFLINNLSFPRNLLKGIVLLSVVYLIITMVYSLTVSEVYPGINFRNIFSYIISMVSIGLIVGTFFLGEWLFLKLKKPKIQAIGRIDSDNF